MPPGFDPAGGFFKALYGLLLGVFAKRGLPANARTLTMELGSGYDHLAWSGSRKLRIVARARGRLGVPYRLGAEYRPGAAAPAATDCSELVQDAFGSEGLDIPDGAVNQFGYCRPVRNAPGAADLGFLHYMSHRSGAFIWHVGIRTEAGTVIHASASAGRVIEEGAAAFEARAGWKGWRRHPELA